MEWSEVFTYIKQAYDLMYVNAITNIQFEMIKKLIIEEKVYQTEKHPTFQEIAKDLHEKFPDIKSDTFSQQ